MTDIENKEIRGITGRILWIVMAGSLSVCATLVWAAASVKTSIAVQEYRINDLDKRVDKLENKPAAKLASNK